MILRELIPFPWTFFHALSSPPFVGSKICGLGREKLSWIEAEDGPGEEGIEGGDADFRPLIQAEAKPTPLCQSHKVELEGGDALRFPCWPSDANS